MDGLPAAIVRHHGRLDEIAEVLAKYGFAAWVQRGSRLVSARVVKGLVDRHVAPEVVAMPPNASTLARRFGVDAPITGL